MNLIVSAHDFYRNRKNLTVLSAGFLTIILISAANTITNTALDDNYYVTDYIRLIICLATAGITLGIFFALSVYIKRLEQTISEQEKSKQMLESIFHNADEGFVVLDRNLRIIDANEAYYRFFSEYERCNRKSFTNYKGSKCRKIEHCFELSHSINRPCYETGETCPAKQSFENGEPFTAIHNHLNAERGESYMETTAYPLKDRDGNVKYCVQTIRDITENLRYEEQKLEAKKMEAIGSLAGGVAHNFNNMLAAILCYGHLAKMKLDENNPALTYIEKILEVSDKASRISHDLLAYSSKSLIDPHPLKTNEIVRSMQNTIADFAGEKVEVALKLTGQEPVVIADGVQIEKLFFCLADNAIAAMPEGGRLEIETVVTDLNSEYLKAKGYGRAGKYVRISFKDTGTGIKQNIINRIFDPFFTTKGVGEGDGLGLSVAYGIVRQHNGYIECCSEEGIGSTFYIYLPVIPLENSGSSEFVLKTA